MKRSEIIAAVRRSGKYTEKDHRDWVDKHNKGVSHLGVPPTTWSILSLAFDVFHGRTNYVKLQIQYIRKMLKGDYDLINQFSLFLLANLKTWKSFQITLFLKNDPNSKLRS